MLGIDKIKAVFTFVFGGYDFYVAIMEDGKISVGDLPALITFLPTIPEVIANAPEAYAQFLDFTPEEIIEFKVWAKDEFDIPDDELEAKIEEIFSIAADLGAIGLRIAALFKPAE